MALKRAVEINQGLGCSGNTALLPYVQRRGKGLLHGILGEIKIPEQAYQTRQNSARIGSVQCLKGLTHLYRRTIRHSAEGSKPSSIDQLEDSTALS